MARTVKSRLSIAIRTLLLLFLAERTAFGQVQGMQSFSNRIEGTNVHTNALQDFTLIALHRGFQTFPRNATLHVRFFLPRSMDDPQKQFFLNAVELQDSFHYLMQAKTTGSWKDGNWNVFEPWPTKDVIDELGVEATNLGVLAGYRVGNEQPVYLPVDVYQDPSAFSKGVYTFHFITGQSLQSLDVTVTNSQGVPAKLPKLQLKCNKSFNP